MTTVAVVGGSGFLGRYVLKELERKSNVILVDKVIDDTKSGRATAIKGDALKPDFLKEVFLSHKIQTVIHLVGLPSIPECESDPGRSFELNVLSTQMVLEAMRLADVQRMVFASSAAVYGYGKSGMASEGDELRPDTIYGFHKMCSELVIRSYCERYGLSAAALRIFNIFGNANTGKDVLSFFIGNARDGKPLTINGPNKFRDFVSVQTVAQAFSRACESLPGHSVINVGSGTRITLHELGEILKSTLPNVHIVERPSADDGTGLVADVTLTRKLLGIAFTDPREGLTTFVKSQLQKER